MKRDWIQIISSIAIVVGLVIVVFELNQNSIHQRAQLTHDDYVNLHTHMYTLMGENPAAVIAKARTSPQELSEEERIVVDAHLFSQYLFLESYEYIEQMGVFADDWKDVVPVVIKKYFDYPYARSWWQRESTAGRKWTSELQELFNEALVDPSE